MWNNDFNKILIHISKNFLPTDLKRSKLTDNYFIDTLKENMEFFRSNEFSLAYHERMNINGTNKEQFENKLIYVEKKPVIIGIRFRNLKPKEPFIVVFPSCNIFDLGIYYKLCKSIKDNYGIFNVNKIQIKILPEVLKSNKFNFEYQIDFGHYSNKIEQCADLENIKNIELKKKNPEEIYPKLEKEYQLVQDENINLDNQVVCESLESLTKSYKQELFFLAYINNNLIGVISGKKDSFFGNPGILVTSQIIFKEYRGRGYGKYLQNIFINTLRNSKTYLNYYLYGTIKNKNFTSINVAKNNNRSARIYDVFIPII